LFKPLCPPLERSHVCFKAMLCSENALALIIGMPPMPEFKELSADFFLVHAHHQASEQVNLL